MEISKMRAPALKNWINKLEDMLKVENDINNIALYKKWLKDAKDEQLARFERRENYLRWKNGK